MSILWACAAPRPASAQSREVDPEALLDRGESLRREGLNEGAVEALRRAVELRRSGRALAQLGLAERALGRTIDAEAHLAEALLLVGDDAWVRHHRRSLESSLADARAGIGSVRVTSNIEGAEVRVNGALAGRTPLRQEVRVPVGRATIELRAEGCTTASRQVSVLHGEATEAHVPLERVASSALSEAPPPLRCAQGLVMRDGLCFTPDAPERTGTSPYRWMFYVGGGVAVLTGAIATGLWAGGNAAETDYLARCGGATAPASCEAERAAAQESLSSRATTVNTLWVFSGLAAATAIVGLVLDLRPPRRDPSARFTLTAAGARLTW